MLPMFLLVVGMFVGVMICENRMLQLVTHNFVSDHRVVPSIKTESKQRMLLDFKVTPYPNQTALDQTALDLDVDNLMEKFKYIDEKCGNLSRALDMLEKSDENRYVVFQCRAIDDCGGWGDRLAGLSSATYLALITKRKLKINWPGLARVARPNLVNWTYSQDELNISAEDREFLNRTAVRAKRPRKIVQRTGRQVDVGIIAAVNDEEFWNDVLSGKYNFDSYRIIFFHSNRGGGRQVLDLLEREHGVLGHLFSNGQLQSRQSTKGLYYCIWRTLLIPSRELLNMKLNVTNSSLLTFGGLLSKVSDPAGCSFGLVHRFRDSEMNPPLPKNMTNCFSKMPKDTCRPGAKRILVFISNSVPANIEASQRFADNFDEIFTSVEDVAERHIDPKDFARKHPLDEVASIINRATDLAAADWYTMTAVGTLLLRGGSGFSSSAALYSRGYQVLVNAQSCRLLDPERLEASRYW
jgi:hypothetical protein